MQPEPVLGSKKYKRHGVRGKRAGRTGLRADLVREGVPDHGYDVGWWYACPPKWVRKKGHHSVRRYWRDRLIDIKKAS